MSKKGETLQVVIIVTKRGPIKIRPIVQVLSLDQIDRKAGLRLGTQHLGRKLRVSKGYR
jgi:hypothetical protein